MTSQEHNAKGKTMDAETLRDFDRLLKMAYDATHRNFAKACDSLSNGEDTANEKIGRCTDANRDEWIAAYQKWSVATAKLEYEIL